MKDVKPNYLFNKLIIVTLLSACFISVAFADSEQQLNEPSFWDKTVQFFDDAWNSTKEGSKDAWYNTQEVSG